MLWSEIKRWAKDKGYDIVKEKDDSINGASYYWMKRDDHSVSGASPSVSKLATAIFNSITNNTYLEYQKNYQENQEYKQATLTDY